MPSVPPQVLVTVCARGGSKGVPGKNIKSLAGTPLIIRTLETARATAGIGRIIVSTDSEEIAAVVRAAGFEVPFLRPAALATDAAAKAPAILHATEFVERESGFHPDIVLDLDIGVALREPQDISACLDVFARHPALDAVVTIYEADRNPYFNMVELDGPLLHLSKPGANVVARQAAPKVYAVSGSVFGWRRASLPATTHLYTGKWGHCIIPRERAIDIDTPLDLAFVEFLLHRRGAATS